MKNPAIKKETGAFENGINILEEIRKSSTHGGAKSLFSSARFERTVFERDYDSGRLKIIMDSFPESRAYLYHVSFSVHVARQITFGIEAESIWQSEVSGRVATFIQREGRYFLIPNLPVVRRYDKKRHVACERSDYYVEYGSRVITFQVDFSENESFELIALNFPNEKLDALSGVYKKPHREYTLTGPWVAVAPLLDCWRFMINGDIYEYREGKSREASARFSSQQAALFLYQLVSIEQKRSECLAQIIKDEIAYSVLLNMEGDGRWVHGCWTDEMETHTRFQADGVHLLLDHFEETEDPAFLERALSGAQYLLSLTDALEGGALWFLHDTLELGKHYIYPVVKSRAFKKSETNILCLNTHLSALCALARLYDKTKKEELKTAVERGLRAAEMVLKPEPATNLYRLLCYFVDLSFDRTYGTRKRFMGLRETLRIAAGHGAGRLLPYAKKAFPRFLMPNGFTTRHLSLRRESYSYHIINLYDILVLYQLLALKGYGGLDWLWNAADMAVRYCLEGRLTEHLIRKKDKFIPQLVEALIIYGAFEREFDKTKLVEVVLNLKDNGYRFTSGCYGSDNLVTPEEYRTSEVELSADSLHIESFNTSPRDKKFKELLVINTGSGEEEVNVVVRDAAKRIEIVSSSGGRVESHRFSLSSRDYSLIKVYDVESG